MLEKGLIQVYTGDGKGKTTAALGLAMRAAGHKNNVLVYQFLKPSSIETGERLAICAHSLHIEFKAIATNWNMETSFHDNMLLERARSEIHDALGEVAAHAKKREYDVIVLDEIVFCLSKGLAKFKDIRKIFDERHRAVEIVLTGRGASQELIDKADLVTEMRLIKHPYDKGFGARKGIEF